MGSDTVTKIAPRWEWRAFGTHFGKAEAALAALDPIAVQESTETYLLAAANANVKLRDGLMDIKIRRAVAEDGLEQWVPVMKAAFPLSREDAARVLAALHRPVPGPMGECYDLDAFLRAFAGPRSGIRVVNVAKTRTRYSVGGCMAELADVIADGRRTRTVAVEAEDARAVRRTVDRLGLGDWINTSYPAGLSALADGAPERFAVIDVGTNSVKFHVGERGADGAWRTVVDGAAVTRLGEGMSGTGQIGEAAAARTLSAIAGMAERARHAGARAIAAVGTAGLRSASNASEVIEAIRATTGVRVEVISGDDEARLAFLGACEGLGQPAGTNVMFETGGGSSQFTFWHDGVVDERFSLDVGAVRYTERFRLDGAVPTEVVARARAEISADLAGLRGRPVPAALVGIGGAVTNLAAVMHGLATYDAGVVQGTVLGAAEVDRQIELYCARDAEARRSIPGLQPGRAEVILAGACIVRSVMDLLGVKGLTVSDRGLRHGVLFERFGGRRMARGPVPGPACGKGRAVNGG